MLLQCSLMRTLCDGFSVDHCNPIAAYARLRSVGLVLFKRTVCFQMFLAASRMRMDSLHLHKHSCIVLKADGFPGIQIKGPVFVC